MKDSSDKVVCAIYGLFGAALGFLIYLFACGGWMFVLTGQATKPWNGAIALIISCLLGGDWGLVAHKYSDREFGAGGRLTRPEAQRLAMTKGLVLPDQNDFSLAELYCGAVSNLTLKVERQVGFAQ